MPARADHRSRSTTIVLGERIRTAVRPFGPHRGVALMPVGELPFSTGEPESGTRVGPARVAELWSVPFVP